MPTETMTPKERWLAVLQRKTPDRTPMDYWGTDETMERLMQHLGCADAVEQFEAGRLLPGFERRFRQMLAGGDAFAQ